MRKFEKISYDQFKKDITDDMDLYNSYTLPRRKTKNSAGYDIKSLIDCILKPGESIIVPTGIKFYSPANEVLLIIIRSSLGVKHGIKLSNQVGVIDSDYYNNPDNEGHIYIKIENSSDKAFTLNKGEAVAQGIFIKYETVTDEEEIDKERIGGFGSTGV